MATTDEALTAPTKHYELAALKRSRDFVIKYNDQQIFWVREKAGLLSGSQINIHRRDETIVAACKHRYLSRERRVCLRDPIDTKDEWIDFNCTGTFMFRGNSYTWMQADDKTSGSNRSHTWGYKLVSDTTEHPIAAYSSNRKNYLDPVPRIDFFVELEKDLELVGLATLFGIAKMRRGALSPAASLAMGAGAAGVGIGIGGGG